MTTHFTDLTRRAAENGIVSTDEVLALRRQGWGDGIIARDEAEALFAMNNSLEERSEEWCDFFVEAIGEFVLNGTAPRLQCGDQEAEWLIAQIDHDGALESMVELETMVRIIERAQNTPESLKKYVLAQIEREVLTGTGPTRCGGELSAVHISQAECQILRRVIFASGGHGPAAVSRFDAEFLFRLKDPTLGNDNCAEWGDVFVDGVANYLGGFTMAHAQLSHGKRLELERFIADNQANVGRFMGRMVREAPQVANNVGNVMGVVFGKRKGGAVSEFAGEEISARAAKGAQVTEAELDWLDAMVQADGKLDDLERRLIKRLEADA